MLLSDAKPSHLLSVSNNKILPNTWKSGSLKVVHISLTLFGLLLGGQSEDASQWDATASKWWLTVMANKGEDGPFRSEWGAAVPTHTCSTHAPYSAIWPHWNWRTQWTTHQCHQNQVGDSMVGDCLMPGILKVLPSINFGWTNKITSLRLSGLIGFGQASFSIVQREQE